MFEFHNNFTANGSKASVDGVNATNKSLHETLEITHGFTPWFETGFYIFTSARDEQGFQYVGSHIRPRFHVPENFHWPVGASLSMELGYQKRQFSEDTWSLEIRPIIDKKWNRWYWAVNPTLEKSLNRDAPNKNLIFSPNAKISYDATSVITLGVEYYGSLGPLRDFSSVQDQQQQIFPSVDLNLSEEWEVNFGVGFGMTSSTDRLILKTIIGRFEFDETVIFLFKLFDNDR